MTLFILNYCLSWQTKWTSLTNQSRLHTYLDQRSAAPSKTKGDNVPDLPVVDPKSHSHSVLSSLTRLDIKACLKAVRSPEMKLSLASLLTFAIINRYLSKTDIALSVFQIRVLKKFLLIPSPPFNEREFAFKIPSKTLALSYKVAKGHS